MRSDPLVLGKDGEPNEASRAITWEKYPAWKIIVLDLETWKRKTRKEFSYKRAREVATRLNEQFQETGQTSTAFVVSRQRGYGPPYSKVSDDDLYERNTMGDWWCPYCRQFRKFNYHAYIGMRICSFCTTRESDFHVKKCNPILWNRKEDWL